MFNCASRPGLGRILMALVDFAECAIRCRSATELQGGPNNEKGWFVGKSMGTAIMNTHWDDGCVLIGCADRFFNYFQQDLVGLQGGAMMRVVREDPASAGLVPVS